MSENDKIDYAKIGLKSGLEIHQQLDSGKLFCHCPGYLKQDKPDYEIKRKLHAIAGETGQVDEAVKHEAKLDREFIYQGYNDNCCLIELDEEPPKMINQEALDEALKIALLLNCEIYPCTQVMRKTVIDGSNTSGFQRTFLLAHDGFIETSFGKVAIDTLALEEDSARPGTSDNDEGDEKTKVWKLDRLGIPLVEIMTKPEMASPEQIKEAALKIGEILRACKVKRGIGTIRQDVNVSIKGHDRVEIKGFQEPGMMIKTVDLEIKRQEKDIEDGKTKGEVRGTLVDGTTKFNRPMPGSARMYPETDLPLLRISRDKINEIKKNLPKLKREIRDELKKKGLSEEMINLVLDNNAVDELETLSKVYSKDANLIAKMIILWPNEFSSKTKKDYNEIKSLLNERTLEKILEELVKGNIQEGDVKKVMNDIISGKSIEDAVRIERVDDNALEEAIAGIIKEKPGLRAGGYMGLIIAKLGANVDKKKAMEILNKLVK
jgi:Glu-tRNA(Gln) amidotransferase subunit E-like FAD-binding protein